MDNPKAENQDPINIRNQTNALQPQNLCPLMQLQQNLPQNAAVTTNSQTRCPQLFQSSRFSIFSENSENQAMECIPKISKECLIEHNGIHVDLFSSLQMSHNHTRTQNAIPDCSQFPPEPPPLFHDCKAISFTFEHEKISDSNGNQCNYNKGQPGQCTNLNRWGQEKEISKADKNGKWYHRRSSKVREIEKRRIIYIRK